MLLLPSAGASLATSGAARAEPVRVLVAAGSGVGIGGEQPLRYAREDARRVAEVFVAVGGVKRENALVVDEPTPSTLAAAFEHARRIAAAHRPDEVTLLFYFSGHGDAQAIHAGERAVPLTDLAGQMGQVPASLKLAIVDACRNVGTRPKGLSAEAPFAISLTSAPAASGAVWLHASADGEAAQESDELGGAIFTHYWVAGLRGAADTNGDGKVTLSESYDFAYHQTLYRSARGAGTLQRPAASFALREAYPLVLTQTAATSAVKLPRSADAQYLVYALGSHTVAAEAWSSPDRALTLALPAGRYLVQRRAPGANGAIEVSLGANEQRDLAAGDFRPFAQETLAQKGGTVVVRPHELEIGYGAGASALYAFGQSLRWRYAYRFDAWAISLGTEAGLGTDATGAEDVRVTWIGGDARFERRFALGGLGLRVGLGPRASLVAQRLDRTDAARVALAGYPTRQSFRALAWGGDVAVGARVALGGGFALGADLEGWLLFADAGGARAYAGATGLAMATFAF
jgi:hypothetical protein